MYPQKRRIRGWLGLGVAGLWSIIKGRFEAARRSQVGEPGGARRNSFLIYNEMFWC